MYTKLTKTGLKLLQSLNPETAHNVALLCLRTGFLKQEFNYNKSRLQTKIAGLNFKNPVGIAAGFDKNAQAVKGLSQLGFGFIEVGAVTPLPQPGNPKPRLFRVVKDEAIINQFGFNNQGMHIINGRLKKVRTSAIVGINIGANKNKANDPSEFSKVLGVCYENIDFATINISSPNTANLRALQGKSSLSETLSEVTNTNLNLATPKPLFLKISPDLNYKQLEGIVEVALKFKISGIIATNTSSNFASINNSHLTQGGGLSGKPLFTNSTKILALLSKISDGEIPLIGVGGISTAQDAYVKILAGASAVQLYSALTFKGPSLISNIITGLDRILEKEGYANISEAVGLKKQDFC